jgi:hypothetical protein
MAPIPIKNIDVALESYDDIYSDFDISHYVKRELSEDFVKELIKRTSIERDTKSFQVTLSIPAARRDQAAERTIYRRIKQHFAKREENYGLEIRNYQQRGIKYIIAGSLIIILDLAIPKDLSLVNALLNILLVAGWFGVWTGIAKIFDEPATMMVQRKIYSNLASAHYVFVNEEDVMMLRQAESSEALLKEQQQKPVQK